MPVSTTGSSSSFASPTRSPPRLLTTNPPLEDASSLPATRSSSTLAISGAISAASRSPSIRSSTPIPSTSSSERFARFRRIFIYIRNFLGSIVVVMEWGKRAMKRKFITWPAAFALLVAISASVQAQDAGTGQGQNQAVRLSTVEGQVRILQSGQSVTDQAEPNTPLFNGFGVQTGDDGRAELQFPDGTVGRIPPDSSLSLDGLQQGAGDFVLDHGMAYFELRGAERVRFGGYTATSAGAAVLRVKLDEAPGEIAVFDGAIHVDGPDGITADLHGGQSVRIAPKDSMLNVADLIEPDSWDAWNSDRDQALTSAASSATPASKSMDDAANPAWGDLNQNGNWYDVPGEGYVWSPYDASNGSW